MKTANSKKYSKDVLAEIRALHKRSYSQVCYLIAGSYLQILFFPFMYSIYPSIVWVILGAFVIGARQASIYEVNHEAAHYKLMNGASLNKYVSLIFCVIPFFHHIETFSYVQWRRVHRLHHVYLMTEKDPNYLQRQMTGEAETPFSLVDTIKAVLMAVIGSWYGFFTFKQDYVYPDGKTFEKHRYSHLRYLLPIKDDREMQQELLIRWLGYIALLWFIHSFELWTLFLLFWMLPMYTVYPAILKFMDIMDHNWSVESDDLMENSNSRSLHPVIRYFTSNLHRYYHREHHMFPMVPALNMPALHRLLKRAEPHATSE